MGIKEMKRANGTVAFEADVRIANVDRQTVTFHTREQAEKFIETTKAAAQKARRKSASNLIQQAKVGGLRNFERAKLAEVIIAFRESSACSRRAKRSLACVDDFVGNITVAKADEDWCETYVHQMRNMLTPQRKPYAFATIGEHLASIKIVCKWWARQNRVSNPYIGISRECIPQGSSNHRSRRLEIGEHQKILAQIDVLSSRQAHWRCLLTLTLETCARQQELVFARWSELSRDDQIWTIPAEHTKKKTERIIPISPAARAAIAELRSLKRDGDERIFEVFPNPAAVSKGFHKIVTSAKIADLRFHDLRHEAISKRVFQLPPKKLPALMQIVGHKDHASLMRYSHLLEDDVIGMFD